MINFLKVTTVIVAILIWVALLFGGMVTAMLLPFVGLFALAAGNLWGIIICVVGVYGSVMMYKLITGCFDDWSY
jgi:hypothetical protein